MTQSTITDEVTARSSKEPRLPPRFFVIKQGDTFLVADAHGDIQGTADGLFHNDTRILSRFVFTLGGTPLSLLASDVSQDNVFFQFHGTNRPLPPLGDHSTPEGVIHIERKRFLWDGRLYERITLENYAEREARVPLSFAFAGDFRDMFEVRGAGRAARGDVLPAEIEGDGVVLRYRGLDGVVRSTAVAFSMRPTRLGMGSAEFLFSVRRRSRSFLYLEIGEERAVVPSRARFRGGAARARLAMRAHLRRGATVRTANMLFDEWLKKSRADLALLTTVLPSGPFPYAGVPWFSTAFGRDAIITSLQTLWLDPSLSRGVLEFLAATQAREISHFQVSAPGKIMHETRKGEMTNLGELPFGQYYGGVDTTPLFVMLAQGYFERTGDSEFVAELWPALEAAIGWIEAACDANPDGLVGYMPDKAGGLINQAWKDSQDSIFHADGRFPEGPLAVDEVQGYAFGAFRAMAALAKSRSDEVTAKHWRKRAESIRSAVEARYWMDDVAFYALAIDGEGLPCRVRASNPGHLLYVGLPSTERADALATQLDSSSFASGWGIRTLAREELRYNPMSYHNGSVWPHDTALCAAGLARFGRRKQAMRLLNELFEASVHFGMRLPELFCGFERVSGQAPIAYPVACLPQAWSACAVFMILQACLGIRVLAERGEIHVDRPELPVGIERLEINRLAVGDRTVNLVFQRVNDRIVVFSPDERDNSIPIIVHV
jgi:glycogen debranching enzyme